MAGCRPHNPKSNVSRTLEENLRNEVMFDAEEYPLVPRLNSLQMQPPLACASQDTYADPKDAPISNFDNDEPDLVEPEPEPPPKNLPQDLHMPKDGYTPPLAHTIKIHRIDTQKETKHKVRPPPKL